MSGRKINDHAAFMGKGGKDSVLPKGVHHKSESSAEGAGKVSEYQDTSEKIKSTQDAGIGKIKSHKHKEGTRN